MSTPTRTRSASLLFPAIVVAGGVLCSCSPGGRPASARAASSPGHQATSAAPGSPASRPTTTVAPATTSTLAPGSLPQTGQLPSGADPAFRARIADLWQAILSGDVSDAAPAFFPLGAYIQVKGISDPVHDYQTRLIPDYDSDITSLHTRVGTSAVFESVSVPAAAEWIKPGVEYNKGSYWRVYGTTVSFLVGGQPKSFTIASMISWRGQWYIVHLSSIR